MRLEEGSLREILAILGTCEVVVGMHGSIHILNMFLPLHALSVELYPYAVPAENYTPYRHMAGLPGMDLNYAWWVVSRRPSFFLLLSSLAHFFFFFSF